MKLKIRQIEEYTTYIVRDSIVIDTENFEQLKGISKEQAIAYIQDNYDELYPDEGTEWEPDFSYKTSISEMAQEQDIVRDKIYGESTEIEVEALDENEEE